MECYDDRVLTRDVFKALSTYQNDYKPYCDFHKEVFSYGKPRFETLEEPPKPAIGEDHETFAKYREGIHIPFDLLIAPKPILHTNPHDAFKKLEPIGDPEKEEIIKTRPRMYMTPAVCIDDVPDPEMRRLLIECMYTTQSRNAEREATQNFKRPPMCTQFYETSDTVRLKAEHYKPIEERFNHLARDWDNKQTRSFTDATREFWIHKDPPVICGACVDPFKYVVPEETKKTIAGLIADEKLRQPHDKPSPSFAGYKPEFTDGCSLSKVDLPTVHPYLSTAQATTSRYAEDLKK